MNRIKRSLAIAGVAGATILGGLSLGTTISAAQTDSSSSSSAPAAPGTDTTPNPDRPADCDQGPGRPHGPNLDVAASAIGIDASELRDALHNGSTLAQVAEDHGVDPQTVIDALVADTQQHLADKVTSGEITQEQANEHLADAIRADHRLREQRQARPPRRSPAGRRHRGLHPRRRPCRFLTSTSGRTSPGPAAVPRTGPKDTSDAVLAHQPRRCRRDDPRPRRRRRVDRHPRGRPEHSEHIDRAERLPSPSRRWSKPCSRADPSTARGNNLGDPRSAPPDQPYARLADADYADGTARWPAVPARSLRVEPHLQRPRPEHLLRDRAQPVGLRVGSVPRPHHRPRHESRQRSATIPFNANDPLETFNDDLGVIPFTR